MTATCAICVADIVGEPRREPLGRDDQLVNVCWNCATETPRAYSSERGYEPTGGLLREQDATRGARRAMGDREYDRRAQVEERLAMAPGRKLTDAERDLAAYDNESKRMVEVRRNTWAPNGRRGR